MWAALMACVRESLETTFNGKVPVFFFNDFVYACGKTAAFRDIVGGREFTIDGRGQLAPGAFIQVGNNKSTEVDGYYAGPAMTSAPAGAVPMARRYSGSCRPG